jgi:hypothetical protein
VEFSEFPEKAGKNNEFVIFAATLVEEDAGIQSNGN